MIFPLRAVFPLGQIPIVTIIIILICAAIHLTTTHEDLNTRILKYCMKENSSTELTLEYMNEIWHELDEKEDLSCPQAAIFLLGLNIDKLQESIDVDQEHLEQLIKQQQYLKKSVGLSNYRSFDPQNPTLLSLITPLFHHGNWMHLIGNMYFLLLFGVVLENLLGPLKFTLLYLLSGVASHVIYTLIDWIGIIDAPPTLGASAAIYGVMAGVFVLYPALKIECIFFFITLIRFMTIPAKYLIGFYIFFDLIRMPFMQIYGVNFIGHISGFACVYFYLKHKEKKRLPLNSL